MPRAKRRWDVIEIHAEEGLTYWFIALGLGLFAWFIIHFNDGGPFIPFAIVLLIITAVYFGLGVRKAILIKKVGQFGVICPLCDFENDLTEAPLGDFVCSNCQRMIPIEEGKPIEVSQVKCGYCGELNYFSEKTEFLICEVCNHQIPIDTEASRRATGGKRVAQAFVVTADDNVYEFILVAHGHKTDELIEVLQHMLALNRNQIKQMLQELPVTLLTGITRRKAEMLQAQLALHEAATEFRPMQQSRT
jgi:uncharacterized protein YbaR (Trm112 family)